MKATLLCVMIPSGPLANRLRVIARGSEKTCKAGLLTATCNHPELTYRVVPATNGEKLGDLFSEVARVTKTKRLRKWTWKNLQAWIAANPDWVAGRCEDKVTDPVYWCKDGKYWNYSVVVNGIRNTPIPQSGVKFYLTCQDWRKRTNAGSPTAEEVKAMLEREAEAAAARSDLSIAMVDAAIALEQQPSQ